MSKIAHLQVKCMDLEVGRYLCLPADSEISCQVDKLGSIMLTLALIFADLLQSFGCCSRLAGFQRRFDL